MTPNQRRDEQAEELLKWTKGAIAEIAWQCECNSQSHFRLKNRING